MCGIAGILSLNDAPVFEAKNRILKMLSMLDHRGPDNKGYYISEDNKVIMGNTRLSIVDKNNNFKVPMYSPEYRSVITYNGEIFNFLELRNKLSLKGVKFKTRSDTEVLMMGMQIEGTNFLKQLNGFWGFGFFNEKDKRFIITRDLLGEKSVFYSQTKNELIFCSEVLPILAILRGNLDIDRSSIVSGFKYRTAQPEKTLIKQIKRLKAGHGIEFDLNSKTLTNKIYNRLRPEKYFNFFEKDPSIQEVITLYTEKLLKACKNRIPQEVDFLTTLSGGIDSTLINYFSSIGAKSPIKSLYGISTLKSPKVGKDLSEQDASNFTSAKLGNIHKTFSMIEDDCLDLYEKNYKNSFDGLLCEGVVSYQQLARETKKNKAKVLIISDGPDELLGGYDMDISAIKINKFIKKNKFISGFFKWLAESNISKQFIPHKKLKHIINWTELSNKPFKFRPIHGGTKKVVMEKLFHDDILRDTKNSFGLIPELYSDIIPELDLSQCMSLSYATSSIPEYFNLRSDRGTMRESIELRLPFLDIDLVELMIATPSKYRFHSKFSTKYILRNIVNKNIGPEIALRKKYGFAYAAWHIPRLEKKLNLQSIIRDYSDWEDLGFLPDAKNFLLKPEEGRHRWFGCCIAQTVKAIKTKEFL